MGEAKEWVQNGIRSFENGNMDIEEYAYTKLRESGQVSGYQNLQTEITTDILTLEIITHTPIITNSTTEITLDKSIHKSDKEIAKENKAVEKRIKKAAKENEKKTKALEKAERKAENERPELPPGARFFTAFSTAAARPCR